MKRKIWFIVALLLCLALVAAVVVYFAVIRPKNIQKRELQEAVARYRDEKMERYRQENRQYEPYQVDVAFLGDSLTDAYDLEKYYPQYLVSNRGIGGDTTFDLENRLETSVYDLKPKVAVMLIGANNLSTMFDNYENILVGLKANLPDTKIVLLSLTNMGQEWGKGNELAAYNNVKIQKLAQKYGFFFVDLYGPLMDLSTGEIYPEYTIDGGHLTNLGYQVITAQITPLLEELLPPENEEKVC